MAERNSFDATTGAITNLQWYRLLIQLQAYRGIDEYFDSQDVFHPRLTPKMRLMQIKNALEHKVTRERYLNEKGLGSLSSGGIFDTSTVMDKESKELRARMMVVLDICITDEDNTAPDFATTITSTSEVITDAPYQ